MKPDSSSDWPDTSSQLPPSGNPYASAEWLLGRHRQLASVAARVPGVVAMDADGRPDIDLEALADAVLGLDAYRTAWAAYEEVHPAPHEEDGFDDWEAAGPKLTPASRAIGVMSRTEAAKLRLLAVFSSQRVPVGIWDTQGLDDARRRMLADWCQALLAT
jgi:hypothetical protein